MLPPELPLPAHATKASGAKKIKGYFDILCIASTFFGGASKFLLDMMKHPTTASKRHESELRFPSHKSSLLTVRQLHHAIGRPPLE